MPEGPTAPTVIQAPTAVSSSKKRNMTPVYLVVVAMVFFAVGALMFHGGTATSNVVAGGSLGSQDAVAAKAVSYINTNLITNGSVTLSSITDKGSLYLMNISYNGQTIEIYVSKDGNYIIPGAGYVLDMNAPLPTQPAGSQAPTGSGQPVNITIGDSPSIGNTSARVTVVEFADFSCPYCEAASGDNAQMVAYMQQQSPSWQPIVTNLMKDYVQTGKVRFVYKFSAGHTGGKPASTVGWCLYDQSPDAFWKFYAQAFASQSADVENLTLMENIAKGLGADMGKLQACIDSKKYDARFAQEQSQSDQAGVQGTPAFFVNGVLVNGAVPYAQVKALIDADLAGPA